MAAFREIEGICKAGDRSGASSSGDPDVAVESSTAAVAKAARAMEDAERFAETARHVAAAVRAEVEAEKAVAEAPALLRNQAQYIGSLESQLREREAERVCREFGCRAPVAAARAQNAQSVPCGKQVGFAAHGRIECAPPP